MFRFACPLLFAIVTTGCVLLHTGTDGSGGDAGSASTTTAQGGAGVGGSGGATGGSGGAGGSCDPIVTLPAASATCPIADFELFASAAGTNITADLGVVSTINGRTTLLGSHDAGFNVGTVGLTHLGSYNNFFILNLDDAGAAESGYELKIRFGASATHLVATSDGGVVAAFKGSTFRLDGAAADIPGLDDGNQDDALLVKLSASGGYEWHLQLEGGTDSMFVDLLQLDSNGNLVVGGRVEGVGILQVWRGTESQPNVVPGRPGPSFFLLTYNDQGTRLDEVVGAGNARLAGVRDAANGFRYVVGSYEGDFPDFGQAEPLGAAAPAQLFAVRLDGQGAVSQPRSFGFDERDNKAVGVVDTASGLAIFAEAAKSSAQSVFSTDPSVILGAGDGATYVTKLDYDLEHEWVQANILAGPASARSGFIPTTGGLAMAHGLGDSGSVTFDAETFQAPNTDSLFVRVDGCGVPLGSYDVTPSAAGATAYLGATSTSCGDLVFGTHGGAAFTLLGATVPTVPNGSSQGLVLFRSNGIPFE